LRLILHQLINAAGAYDDERQRNRCPRGGVQRRQKTFGNMHDNPPR
jgi:hypothetical protein